MTPGSTETHEKVDDGWLDPLAGVPNFLSDGRLGMVTKFGSAVFGGKRFCSLSSIKKTTCLLPKVWKMSFEGRSTLVACGISEC